MSERDGDADFGWGESSRFAAHLDRGWALLDRGETVVGVDNLDPYYDVALKRARLAQLAPHPAFAFVAADVADRSAVDQSIARAAAELGRIDIVVNNAGTNTPKRALGNIDPADWDAVVGVNLTGAYNVTRASLEALRRSGHGLVINVGSTAAVYASRIPGIAYTASKHAITGFTAALRRSGNTCPS